MLGRRRRFSGQARVLYGRDGLYPAGCPPVEEAYRTYGEMRPVVDAFRLGMSGLAGYDAPMSRRYGILALVAFVIVSADQGSKFLAVKYLTPGLGVAAQAAAGEATYVAPTPTPETLVQDVPLTTQIGLFLTEVRSPCDGRSPRYCPERRVVEGFWSWRYAENKGAAWSMFAQWGDHFRLPFLIGVSTLAVIFILGFVRKLEPHQNLVFAALSLILGGAIGNLIDRIYLGYVIDFILWYYDGFYWPTFNIADAAISVGVGLMLVANLRDWLASRSGRQNEGESSVAQS